MNLIVRNEKNEKPEPFEVRTTRIIAQEGMESWDDEQIAAVAIDFDDPRQDSAALIQRRRANAAFGQSPSNPGPESSKWMWTR